RQTRHAPGTHEVELTLELPATAYLQLELRTSSPDGNIYFCSVSLRRMRLGDKAMHSRVGSEQDDNAAVTGFPFGLKWSVHHAMANGRTLDFAMGGGGWDVAESQAGR